MKITNHCRTRSQQRSIPPLVVDWLLEFGATSHDKKGAVIHYFDKKSRKRLSQHVGKQIVDRLSNLLDAYIVTANDTILTVGHRYRRVPSN